MRDQKVSRATRHMPVLKYDYGAQGLGLHMVVHIVTLNIEMDKS